MIKLRSIAIAVTITYCLFLINSSYAAEITSLSTGYVGGDYGDGGWVSVRLIADEDISWIDWYINDEYDKTTMHSNGTRWVYTSLDGFLGRLKGKKNNITAIVWFWDGDEFISDTESDEFRVFRPIVVTEVHGTRGQQHLDIDGTVVLFRHYHDGSSIVMDGQVVAFSDDNIEYYGSAWFRHTRMDPNPVPFQEEHNAPSIKFDSMYGPYYTDSSILNFPVDGPIEGDKSYTLNAHIHMVTGEDARHVDSTNTFTEDDNP